MSTLRRGCALGLGAALVFAAAACGTTTDQPKNTAATSPATAGTTTSAVAMAHPGAFKPPLESPDILVQSQDGLPASVVAAAKALPGVVAVEQFSLATFYYQENSVTYAAVDPATFRRFTPGPTAEDDEVWNRVADGEIALRPDLKATLASPTDYVAMGNDADSSEAHIGAYAPLLDRSQVGAIVNERWASKLHMPAGNALVVSTGNAAPGPIVKELAALVGQRASVTQLALHFDVHAVQTAILTGGPISQAVGSFTYTANKNGTVNPEPRWIRAYIRTEQVPIIGDVTCNKGMIPQLRAALDEVVARGLSSAIHPSQYGGCYVPRFIANNPAQGLSFHTFGTAIDLNVPENERGTVGKMNRTVVAIFKKWGFNWGGGWHYTDPMHFELARLVKVG
ncbi:MAG TPA: M15 family metallopeptidase [Marmoricola sp.]|nr:M15 family metallopeptidase [Marmoricola sp.]